MILAIECIVSCVLFGAFIILSVMKNQTAWINEYPEPIQKRYIELHPDSEIKEPEGLSPRVIFKKLLACLIFLILLVGMVYLAGAKSFMHGTLYCYCIWFAVNVFDTIVLDLGLMVHWKKCRLPGTEDMDKEYKLLTKKSLLDGVYGCIIGIPIALLTGLIISLICK
ncbi:MAG: hypothetical protein ACI4KF_06435 [Huintestinicola sp.]